MHTQGAAPAQDVGFPRAGARLTINTLGAPKGVPGLQLGTTSSPVPKQPHTPPHSALLPPPARSFNHQFTLHPACRAL